MHAIEVHRSFYLPLRSSIGDPAMLKKLLLLLAALVVAMSTATATATAATVDVNTADKATLETLKGIGPVKSQAIIDERNKHGAFKDADDLARRVPGLGVKSVTKLEANGLTVGGSSAPPTAAGNKREMPPAAAAANTAHSPAKTAVPAPSAPAPAPAAASTAAASAPNPSSSKSHKPSKKSKARGASAASGA